MFGGEWEFDRYNAILHKERGQNRGVSIEYSKNLTDVTQDEACSDMYTAVYPYYYQEDDGLQRLDEDVVKILDTTYNNVCVLDLTSEFDEMPTQDQLRAKTQEYIKDNKLGEPKVSLKVSFIKNPEVIEALQDVRLGDTVGVKFIKIGVNTTSRCINYEFNVLTEQYNSIGLGEPTKTIVDTMTSTSSRIDAANGAISDTQNDLDDTKEDLTDEIDRATGAEGALSTRITKTEEGLLAEVSNRQNADNEMLTKVSQTAHSIALVASGGDNSVGITIQLYDENGNLIDTDSGNANINIVGFVTFSDLAGNGTTTINGNNIKTGTISCDLLSGGTINGQTFYGGKIKSEDMVCANAFYMSSTIPWYGNPDYSGDLQVFHLNRGNIVSFDVPINAENFGNSHSASYATSAGSASSATNATNATYLKNGSYVQISSNGNLIPNSSDVACGTSANPFKIGYSVSGWNTTSDERVKKDFVSLDDDKRFEAFFYLLNPTEYKLKSDKDGIVRVGFGAQTVKAAMDAAGIAENEFHGFSHEYVDMSQFETEEERQQFLERNCGNADTYSLSYQEFIALNTHMIQKQHQEIEALKLENVQIKGEVDILKQRLKIMEEKLC